MAKDDEPLPKKKVTTSPKARPVSDGSGGPSSQMRSLMRIVRTGGGLLGGFVTLVGVMSLVGLITDIFWIRLVGGLLIVVGLPAFVSDRLLKKRDALTGRRKLSMVGDVFAIVLLAVALVLVSIEFVSKPLLVREGDRYARSGSRTMARVVYFLGGVSPTFPEASGAPGAPSGSAAGSASAPPASSSQAAPAGSSPR